MMAHAAVHEFSYICPAALRVSEVFFPGFFELVKLQVLPASSVEWLAAILIAVKLPKLLVTSLGFRSVSLCTVVMPVMTSHSCQYA